MSIHRPDKPDPYSEDLVVRAVWWRLEHLETRAIVPDGNSRIGKAAEIFVECDAAIGPYATDRWRDAAEAARQRGVEVEEFPIRRFSIRESDLPKS